MPRDRPDPDRVYLWREPNEDPRGDDPHLSSLYLLRGSDLEPQGRRPLVLSTIWAASVAWVVGAQVAASPEPDALLGTAVVALLASLAGLGLLVRSARLWRERLADSPIAARHRLPGIRADGSRPAPSAPELLLAELDRAAALMHPVLMDVTDHRDALVAVLAMAGRVRRARRSLDEHPVPAAVQEALDGLADHPAVQEVALMLLHHQRRERDRAEQAQGRRTRTALRILDDRREPPAPNKETK